MTRGRGRTKRARGGRGGTPGSRDNKAPTAGGPFTTTPLPSRTPQLVVPGFESAQTQAPVAHPPTAESVAVSVAEKPPVPVPITSFVPPPRSESPLIVVDVDSADEGPAMKKRRINVDC